MKKRKKSKTTPAPAIAEQPLPPAIKTRRDALRSRLLPYQRNWVEDQSRFKIGLWARQTGKDFTNAEEGINDCLYAEFAKKKTTWLIVAPSERQSLESLEKWKHWAAEYKLAVADLVEERTDARNSQSLVKSSTLTFAHGSRVIAVPGRPDTVRGFSAHVLVTEFAFFEDPDRTWRALLPSITNPLDGTVKKCRLVSTPNGRNNKFYDLWSKNFRGGDGALRRPSHSYGGANTDEARDFPGRAGTLPAIAQRATAGPLTADAEAVGALAGNVFSDSGAANTFGGQPLAWSCHKVTITDAVEQGLPLNLDELRAALDDPEGWAQEYDPLDFLDTSSVLLPYDLITECENPNATETCDPAFWEVGGAGAPSPSAAATYDPVFCGIDFGRKRDLTVCWSLQLLGGVFKLTKEVLCLEARSSPEQIEILRPRIQRARRVCFDYTGPGIGLGDFLAQEFGQYNPEKHLFGKIELCSFTNTLKTEIFPKLRMELERNVVGLPVSRAVREDLHSMNRVTLAGGGVTYRAPHTDDGHADRCTALALAIRAAASAGVTGGIVSLAGIRTGPNVLPNGRPQFVPMRLNSGRPGSTAGLPRFTENGIPILGR